MVLFLTFAPENPWNLSALYLLICNSIQLAMLRTNYTDLGAQSVTVTYMIFIVILFCPYGYHKQLACIK